MCCSSMLVNCIQHLLICKMDLHIVIYTMLGIALQSILIFDHDIALDEDILLIKLAVFEWYLHCMY